METEARNKNSAEYHTFFLSLYEAPYPIENTVYLPLFLLVLLLSVLETEGIHSLAKGLGRGSQFQRLKNLIPVLDQRESAKTQRSKGYVVVVLPSRVLQKDVVHLG